MPNEALENFSPDWTDPWARPGLEATYMMAWAPPGAKVGFDMGCGDRTSAPWLIGVDHHCGRWTSKGGLVFMTTPDVVADVRHVPFPDGCADLVVSKHTLEHFADSAEVLPEWIRLLRLGGYLVIVVPDYRYTYSCCNADQRVAGPGEGHKQDFTLEMLCYDVARFCEQLKFVDARETCTHWSVGAALERVQ